jgi:glycosyltransferase A (GT-A) superfamily protein (DUF2064 family)
MIQLIVVAKEPVAGRVKTRLCPPCTPDEAARIAAAALDDTLDVATLVPAVSRTLVLEGHHPVPPGWIIVPQRGYGLANRLVHAFADTWICGVPSLLIGMDTPQITRETVTAAAALLESADDDLAVYGPAADGGWWALGLRRPLHAEALRGVPMSTPETGARTLFALRRLGVRVDSLPELRDVDTAADALAVARLCPPRSRFATAVAQLVSATVSEAGVTP